MFLDSRYFGLANAAIAMEIAEKIGDRQPKSKLNDSVKRFPATTRHALAALLNFTTTILSKRAHHAAVNETLEVNR
jgi:hypothetical protein